MKLFRAFSVLSLGILVIFVLASCSLFGRTVIYYENPESYTAGDSDCETSVAPSVTAIDIEWVSGKASVIYHDIGEVILRESSSETPLYYKVEGSVLTVKYAKSGDYTALSNKELTVYLPRGLELDFLGLDGGSADFDVNGITADNLDAETGSGNVTLRNMTIGDAEIETASGDITVAESTILREASAEAASGNINITLFGDCPEIEADTASGDITIKAERVNTISAEAASGEIDIAIAELPGELMVDSTSGDVTLWVEGTASGEVYCHTTSGSITDNHPGIQAVTGVVSRCEIETTSGNITIKIRG